MSAVPLLFDAFRPGADMGAATERVDAALLARWRELYPWDEPAPREAPAAVATVLIMRAYMKVIAPRPPGNIHARQRTELAALPRLGEEVTTRFRCSGKELRKERRYVQLATRSTGEAGRLLFTSAMTLIWAA